LSTSRPIVKSPFERLATLATIEAVCSRFPALGQPCERVHCRAYMEI
jgi:hypothetical protein